MFADGLSDSGSPNACRKMLVYLQITQQNHWMPRSHYWCILPVTKCFEMSCSRDTGTNTVNLLSERLSWAKYRTI